MQVEVDTDMEEWEYCDAKDEIVLALESLGDTLGVEGTDIGWNHQSIKGTVESHMAWGMLALRGEFRLVAELGEHEVIVRRYSHDEPMGTAQFNFFRADDTPRI